MITKYQLILSLTIFAVFTGSLSSAQISIKSHHHVASHGSSHVHLGHPSFHGCYHTHYRENYHRSSYQRDNYNNGNGTYMTTNHLNIGGGVPFMTADIIQNYYVEHPDVLVNGVWMTNTTGPALNANIHNHLMSTRTWGANLGYTFPLAHLGRSVCLALETDLSAEYFYWNIGTVNYDGNTSAVDTMYSIHVKMPVSLQLQFGGEADQRRSHTIFNIGAGGAVTSTVSRFIATQTVVGWRPFAMAEVGIMGGFPVKLRATAYWNNFTLIDNNNSTLFDAAQADGNIDGRLSVKMTGGLSYNFSLVIMPFWKSTRSY